LTVSGLEQSGLEALTTPPRTLAIELAVERTFMFRGGAGAMTVSRDEAPAACEVASRLKPLSPGPARTFTVISPFLAAPTFPGDLARRRIGQPCPWRSIRKGHPIHAAPDTNATEATAPYRQG
uniref:hypothetical protein n=1 Tax=uncultured Thiodictyon sp. TaxID=1846217 RepID=UPI0025E912F5